MKNWPKAVASPQSSASTQIWAAATQTERVTEDAGAVLWCLDLESLQADVHKCICEARALKQRYEESRVAMEGH